MLHCCEILRRSCLSNATSLESFFEQECFAWRVAILHLALLYFYLLPEFTNLTPFTGGPSSRHNLRVDGELYPCMI